MRNNDDIVTLIEAAGNGNVEVIENLLNYGADIHARDNSGRTALIIAANYGHHNVVELLLNRGADIHARNNYNGTALIIAANYGHHNIVELLLNRGADIHARDNSGWTALIATILTRHHNIAELLLNHGADIHARNIRGYTALMQAAALRNFNAIGFLIKQGAQFEGLDIRRLPETGASEFSNQIAQGHVEAAGALLDATPELLNQVNQFGQTPLMRAVICGQLGAVNWLIDQGADLNAVSDNGFTALYFAARAFLSHRHEDEEAQAPYLAMLETIVAHNPDVDALTQALIARDHTGILDTLIYPHIFVLK